MVPVITYGMQLWWHSNLKNVKWHMAESANVQAKAARWIIGGFRTTLTGALNALAGLPPIKGRSRHLMNKAALRVHKLLDKEFPNRIKFCLLHPLKSKKKEFENWYEKTFVPKLHSLMWGFERKKVIYIVFTDGSAKKTVQTDKPTRYRSSSSYLVLKQSLENNRHVKYATLASRKTTSYDAEVMALAAGIKNAIRAGGTNLRKLHIFTDNQTALRDIVKPGCYSGQMFTLSMIKDLRRFLCKSLEHSITLHWCPAHVGVPQNKFID
ncbi:hypothetical protein PHLCEN_2v7493 [Hermanssonia centrifuga]|uniref:RNase H type-1 domain-containing protein n=1 Tax=Hermanssonia centrifuga TaxID=98765 RepID=A0A2R6NWJ5_9APHY|nr:hypothetical protein PHLCEN_2v7493 [Hermanssonia centrifuga]